ncbi:MAG TPA: aspartate aminotransferase family protein [Candidatus Kapabacteria bacterium]|nr:aspartate aminotransferase family protein [Candidatus Kapabacteria bacterium]
MKDLIEREHEVIYQTYQRFPLVVERALGSYLYDNQGNEYLDCLAGIAVNALGHSHPAILKAINEQSQKYLHISNYFYQEPQILLAEKLIELSGMSKVFLCNSGTEATEGAIKLSRKWGHKQGKLNIYGFAGGFHGRSYGALSVMDKPNYKIDMGPYLDNFKVLPLNQIEYLYENINSQTAAIILEFVQGEGGIATPDKEFIDVLLELKHIHNFLIIADEVQCGTGRTGKYFGFENFGVKPDIITTAKGMGGGLPLGSIIVSEELSQVWQKGNHGTTYGGNALACVTGMAVINELENGLLKEVVEKGTYLKLKLEDLQTKYPEQIKEIRGIGLMLGLLMNYESKIIVDKLFDKKVITNAASGYVLRIVPPLTISLAEIDIFINKLNETLSELN